MRKLQLLLPLALLALAVGLVACGGGGESGGGSDEDQVIQVIETAATSDDPADCTKLQTQDFVEQTEFTKGKAAVQSCEDNAGETSADSVEVTNVNVDKARASADASFSGGGFDGQTLELGLVNEGGQWKLDEVVRFQNLDQQELVDTLVEKFESGSEPLDPELAGCIGDALAELSQADFEDATISGNPERIVGIVEGCQ